MQRARTSLALFFVLAIAVTGCAKKSAQQASIPGAGTGTGFDSLSSSEELAQLPQGNTGSPNQQGGVEVLPVETSPVTQGAPLAAGQGAAAVTSSVQTPSSGALNHEQKIQTALKNAGLYSGPIDGKIGPGSKRAIETFQKNNGLKADGKVGPKTWAALEPYLSGHTASAGASAGAASASADQ